MSILSDFRNHLRNGLEGTKFELLIEFYLMAMSLILLFHISMQLIPEIGLSIRNINVFIDWILVLIISLSFLLWKIKKYLTKTVRLIQFGIGAGFLLSLMSTVLTYLTILVSATMHELLLKLAPVLILVTYAIFSYLYEEKSHSKIQPSIALVVLLVSVVGQFKTFGLYIVVYLGLPFSVLLNIYFIITLIYVTHNELAAIKRHD
jgi:hypothetical protein